MRTLAILLLTLFIGAPAALADTPEVKTIYGDLNKDGIKDKVVVETPCNKANMKTRDDGYVYNFNQPVLYIYFGDGKDYKLFKKFDNVMPRKEREEECLDMDVTIKKGVLNIGYSVFYSMGSYGTNKYTYQYRYQNGDFYLIGEESTSGSRSTGDYEKVSTNYLTHKKQVTTGNKTKKKKSKDKTKTTKVPKKELEQLGHKNLKVTD